MWRAKKWEVVGGDVRDALLQLPRWTAARPISANQRWNFTLLAGSDRTEQVERL